ncbi:dihydropteroate synthase [Paenibacillus camelliae]|uniref:dihydropteroate synthase n=1 Tax=Paenibacillus camelliae TaxID=512410 RepID=UPI00203B40E8|nr:dihydropteroate synthase [Paenibacillus camelliae]
MSAPTFWKRSYTLNNDVSLELGNRTLIMGILNVTPDSFSDGGKHNTLDLAVAHAQKLIEDGADIIDIGGESTRPGFTPVSVDEELERVIPVIQAIAAKFPNIPLSIDTYKSETAAKALDAGAHIINDIWCLKYDGQMADVAAQYQCPVILNHNRENSDYAAVVPDVVSDLKYSVELALAAGVKHEDIWLDPGIGFAKGYEENMEVHAHLDQIHALGYPVLLGTSRKKFIRDTLQVEASETLEGIIASNVIGIAQGCQIVRVHDVQAMKKAAMLADAILYRISNKKEHK